jgi:NAD(P)-dependent dehydrogenase (short-subunit alcohol dehydrogenase family)
MTEHNRSATYDRVWFITGASSCLGRALAEAVLARGERAIVTDRNPENLRHLIEQYPAQAFIQQLDVSRRYQVRSVVGQAIERFGCIDVLVNNESLSEGLAVEFAPLGSQVIVVEPEGITRHRLGDPTAEAEAIIAAVDDVAEGEPLPQRYGRRADRRWDVPLDKRRDDATETTHQSRTSGGT